MYRLSLSQVKEIHQLKENGRNNSQISRELKIDRSIVRKYVNLTMEQVKDSFNKIPSATDIPIDPIAYSDIEKLSYAYILGMYFGDGVISKLARTYKIRIYLNSLTDIKEQQRTLTTLNRVLLNRNKIGIYKQKFANCVEIIASSTQLPHLFPQHGAGKKYNRPIELVEWQENILENYSEYFLAGLFDSDGCAYIQTGTNLTYYQFTNKSKDILNLFTYYLEKHNIQWKFHTKKCGNTNIFIRKYEDREKFKNLLTKVWNTLDTEYATC